MLAPIICISFVGTKLLSAPFLYPIFKFKYLPSEGGGGGGGGRKQLKLVDSVR